MSRVKENFLVTVLVLFIARMGLPQYLKYILFPLVGLYGVWALWRFVEGRRWQSIKLKDTLIFIPLLVSMLIYWVMLALTPDPQINLLRDAFNVLVFTSFVVALYLISYTPLEYKKVLNKVAFYTVIISSLFALAGLIKLAFQLYGITFDFLTVDKLGYPMGATLNGDNNAFSLFCLIGIIMAIPYLYKKLTIFNSILLQICLFTIVINVYFSTSRRGIIIILLIIISIILTWFVSFFFKNNSFKSFRLNTLLLIIISIVTIGKFNLFIYDKKPLERTKWLYMHKFDKTETSIFINRMTIQEQLILKGSTEYSDIEEMLWKTEFDSRYPYTGWAMNNFKLERRFDKDALTILPPGAEGARVDSSVQCSNWGGNAYYYSVLFKEAIAKNVEYVASVYCYVTPDFSGNSLEMKVENIIPSIIKDDNASYNFLKAGKWQKLEISFSADTGSYLVGLFMRFDSASNLKGMKGHMIFAYPELKQIPHSQGVLFAETSSNKIIKETSSLKGESKNKVNVSSSQEICLVNNDSLNVRIENSKTILNTQMNKVENEKYVTSNVEPKDTVSSLLQENIVINKKIRKNDSKIFKLLYFFLDPSDSLGHFKMAMSNDFFSGPRVDRWRYAMYIYRYEYSPVQKIFGGGFGYTRKFTDMFRDQWRVTEYDYPHSPFLSVLLYSGIFGLIFYIWLLLGAVKYYWIYRRDFWPFGLAFIVTFFFAFFSSNNPFEPAVMAVFTAIPYFAHYFFLVEKHG